MLFAERAADGRRRCSYAHGNLGDIPVYFVI